MMALLANLFGSRRSRGFGRFGRRPQHGFVNAIGNHRRGAALGTIASIAAPFIVRKLMARRAQRAQGAAY